MASAGVGPGDRQAGTRARRGKPRGTDPAPSGAWPRHSRSSTNPVRTCANKRSCTACTRSPTSICSPSCSEPARRESRRRASPRGSSTRPAVSWGSRVHAGTRSRSGAGSVRRRARASSPPSSSASGRSRPRSTTSATRCRRSTPSSTGRDHDSRLLGATRIAQGGLHGCALTPRDVLRPALRDGGSAIVVIHNHPSGDPTPSPDDIKMTAALAVACDVVGIELLDHVVVARGGATSLREMGAVPGDGPA
jgi:DNA repair protein RadC